MKLSTAALAALLALSAAARPQENAHPPRSGATAHLPVLECWYVVPQPERFHDAAHIHRSLRIRAATIREDAGMRVFERTYSDDEGLMTFLEHPDLRAAYDSRDEQNRDADWSRHFEELIEVTDQESSFRSILLPVAGPAEPPAPRFARILSRTPVDPFRRAAAQSRARELVDHLNANHEGVAAYAYVDDLGTPYELYLILDYQAIWERNPFEHPSSWESTRRALLEDTRYAELLEALGETLERPTVEVVSIELQ